MVPFASHHIYLVHGCEGELAAAVLFLKHLQQTLEPLVPADSIQNDGYRSPTEPL
jgi:hypothetical protein